MPFVYILYSPSSDRFYTGVTTANTNLRLEKHLKEHYGTAYTTSAKDWELFLEITAISIQQAMKIEKHIKSMKSSKYINNLKAYPEIIERLKAKYNIE